MLGMSKGRMALAFIAAVGFVGNIVLEAKESEEARLEQQQAAYKGGCDYVKELHSKKNPKKERKQARREAKSS